MLTCEEAMENLSAFLNHTLPHDLEDEVSSHLWHCEMCPRVTKICDVWVLQELPAAKQKTIPIKMAPPRYPRNKLAPRRTA